MKRLTASLALFLWFVLIGCAIGAIANAHAADVAAIPGVATLTDERGPCPRKWRVAVRHDRERGCYRIEYPSYAIVIRWNDGTSLRLTEMQFEIRGELLP